jgi:hypothetical protein
MKNYKIVLIITLVGFLFSTTSCFVGVHGQGGGKKGWVKNSNNPHHPATTNPGHNKKGKR